MMHFLKLTELNDGKLFRVLDRAKELKKNPKKFSKKLSGKNLVLFLETFSLRTRLSFEIAMQQLGGNAITYTKSESTIGKKETIKDFARVVSSYADLIAARISMQSDLEEMAENSYVPVINAMTNTHHPCQVLGDLLTMLEYKKLKGAKVSYFGDANNNVTHSLLLGCAMSGTNISIACPNSGEFLPQKPIVAEAKSIAEKTGSEILVTNDPFRAITNSDFVYTDSWMSYRIPPEQRSRRFKALEPFQVSQKLMGSANSKARFMHCLPVERGVEATAEVVDGAKSIIYAQAENRLHAQKSLLLLFQTKN